MNSRTVIRPSPKQEQALIRTDFEIGFGGARGGGKTFAGILWLLYDIGNPALRALVIRRNADDMRDWIDRADQVYSDFGAKKAGNPPEFIFPSGAIIRTGHLRDANAYTKYVGHEYQKMLVEELNLIPTEENYLKLISSCRSTVPGLKPQVFSTFNPSDVGFYWIKRRFGIHGTPREPVITKDPRTGLTRIFIPSRLEDNKFLSVDPTYRAFLDGLPDGLREAWRDGSWDEPQISGGIYTLELEQAKREGRIGVIAFDPELLVQTVWDFGIDDDDAMAIGFFQRTSNEVRMIDYYENHNFGISHYSAYLTLLTREKNYRYGQHFAPFDVNKRELSTGLTLKQTSEALGIKFSQVPMIGVEDGIQHVRLMFPRLRVHEHNCDQALSALRNYRRKWNEQLLTWGEPIHDWSSHCADMVRYAALSEKKMMNADPEDEWYGPMPPKKVINPAI